MQVQLTRWGNSLGMRIPKALANRFGLTEGTQVDLEADGERLIISLLRPRYALADLVAGLDHDALAEAFEWGPDKGRERLDDK